MDFQILIAGPVTVFKPLTGLCRSVLDGLMMTQEWSDVECQGQYYLVPKHKAYPMQRALRGLNLRGEFV